MLRGGIYIGWVGFLNLGDEAMYELCRRRFRNAHWSRLQEITYAPNPGKFIRERTGDFRQVLDVLSEELRTHRRMFGIYTKLMHRMAFYLGREIALLGGGTLINRNTELLETYRSVRKRTGAQIPTFGSGVINPEFWLTREEGWSDCRREWVDALAELPAVGVRGPISKILLDDAGARNVVISGDPAVAFHEPYAGKSPMKGADRPLRIGINTGDCSGKMWGNPESVEECLLALVRWLRQSRHQIEVFPVWQKDVQACEDLARRSELDRSVVHPVYYTAESFLRGVENLDLMVCLKLHAGVLAAAANVPFVSLEYQPKCRDFAASIGWEEFVVRTDRVTSKGLIDLVAAMIEQLETRRAALCRHMCSIMQDFGRYCEQIETFWPA